MNQASFHSANRQRLAEKLSAEYGENPPIVIQGNSYVQAAADKTYRFEQDSTFYYFTGLNEPGLTLVIADGKEYLITKSRSPVRIAFEGDLPENELKSTSGIDAVYEEEEAWKQLSAIIKKSTKAFVLKPPADYIDGMDMFANPARGRLIGRLGDLNPKLEMVDIRMTVAAMRSVKSSYELANIRKAVGFSRELYVLIEEVRTSAGNEKDILAEITAWTIRNELEFAYEPIIAAGRNAVTLHYEKNNAPLASGELLLLDIGVKYAGYCSDITRTVGLEASQRQRDVYSSVADVQEYAFSLLKPGITLKEYEEKIGDRMAEELRGLGLIKKADKEEVRKYYPHSTSHFLGLDAHDPGDYEKPLAEGMVLTVEPGIYIREESIGIRLEDDVLITADSHENLTKVLPKNIASLTIER